MAGNEHIPPHLEQKYDYVCANEAYFDAEALETEDHDRPQKVQLAKRVCNAIRKTYPELLDEDATEVMDFACGTGTHNLLRIRVVKLMLTISAN